MKRLDVGELVAIASSALATEFAQPTKGPTPASEGPPCTLGCSSCCYLPVNVTVPEVVHALKAALMGVDVIALGDRIASASDHTRGLDGPDRLRARVACPLLDTRGSCTIYDARPAYCRAYNARSSRDACDRLIGTSKGLADPNAVVVADPAPFDAAFAAQSRIDRDLKHAGAESPHLDLTHALAILYAEPLTYKEWLQGHVDDWVRSR